MEFGSIIIQETGGTAKTILKFQSAAMNIVSRSQLRITIYNIMKEKADDVIIKSDVMQFIESNPYFDEMLKAFLKDKFIEDVDAMIVSEE
jgi:hypothetical protein